MASKQYSPCQNRAVGVEGYQVKCDEEMEDMEVMLSLKRQSSGDNGIQDREDDQAVDEEAEDDGGEVPAQLHQHLPKVAHPQHLVGEFPIIWTISDRLPPARRSGRKLQLEPG